MGVSLQAVPSPSWPKELYPQAQSVPSVFSAMVHNTAADMAVTWEEEGSFDPLSPPEPEEPLQFTTNNKNEKQIKIATLLRIVSTFSI